MAAGRNETGTRPEDFGQLFDAHAEFACRVLRRFGVREGDLADACQDAFIVVHRKLPTFEGRSTLRTWLYRICARVASDYRKRAHRRYETGSLPCEPSVPQEQHRRAEGAELRALIGRALDALDDDKRQVFVLYELEELPMAEVAALLDCPLKTAFSRLYVARSRLRRELSRAGYASLLLPMMPGRLLDTYGAQLASALKATGAPASGGVASASAVGTVGVGGGAGSAAVAATTGAQLWATIGSGAALAVVAAFALGPGPLPLSGTLSAGAVLAPGAAVRAHLVDAGARRVPFARVPTASVAAVREPDPPVAASVARRQARQRGSGVRPAPQAPDVPSPQIATVPVTDWMEAPASPLPRRAPSRARSVGLDEVLSATSIRPLLRVQPDEPDAPWVLVP